MLIYDGRIYIYSFQREGLKDLFVKYTEEVQHKYDYNSIMHFPFTAYSKTLTSKTIRPRGRGTPYSKVSEGDRKRVEAMYFCEGILSSVLIILSP